MARKPITKLLNACKNEQGWSDREIARQLECSKNTIARLRKQGAPRYFHLALMKLMEKH